VPLTCGVRTVIQYGEEHQPTRQYYVDGGHSSDVRDITNASGPSRAPTTLTLTLRTRDQRCTGQGRYFDTYDSSAFGSSSRRLRRTFEYDIRQCNIERHQGRQQVSICDSILTLAKPIDLDRYTYIRPGTCVSTQAKYTIYHNGRKHDTYTRAITSRTRARYQYRIW
jgi:hypothetical protein